MTGAPPRCSCCGRPRRKRANQPGWQGANGLCASCDARWRRHGCPENGPPPPMPAQDRTARSSRTLALARARRMAEYARLRHAGLTQAQAAEEVGVSVKTTRHHGYEAAYWRGTPAEEAA